MERSLETDMTAAAPDPVPAPPVPAMEGPRLFSAIQAGVASLFGTPVAGGLLLAANAGRRRQWVNLALAVVMAGLLTFSLLGFVRYLTFPYGPYLLLPAGAILMVWVARMLQGEQMDAERRAGRLAGNWAVAILVGLLCGAAGYGSLWWYAHTHPAIQAVAVQVEANQFLVCNPAVTGEQAKAVGEVLSADGVFDKSGGKRAVVYQLDAQGRSVIVIVVDPAKVSGEQLVPVMNTLALQLMKTPAAKPIVLRMVDPTGKVVKEAEYRLRAATAPAQ